MSYCENCGTKIEEYARICLECGTSVGLHKSLNRGIKVNLSDMTHKFNPNDIEKNKVMGILGYLVFIVPLIAAKDSPYSRFHANQGFILFLGYVICSLLWIIPILGWIAASLAYVAITVLLIIGLINAANGRAKNLPIVGKIKIFK